jgi:hypothetical protein
MQNAKKGWQPQNNHSKLIIDEGNGAWEVVEDKQMVIALGPLPESAPGEDI